MSDSTTRDHLGSDAGPVAGAWLLIGGEQVPDAWKPRATTMTVVSLLPTEAVAMLAGESPPPELADQEELLGLLAQGLRTVDVARKLNLSPASVARRIARLRDYFDVGSNAELAALLARQGFKR